MAHQERPPETHEQVRILLKYTKEDWATHQKTPTEIAFTGQTLHDVYNQAVAHMVQLEMDDQTNIATDTRVERNGEEVAWDEFEREARAAE